MLSRIETYAIIGEPLCLRDKSIVGTLEDPDEGCDTNYVEAPTFSR